MLNKNKNKKLDIYFYLNALNKHCVGVMSGSRNIKIAKKEEKIKNRLKLKNLISKETVYVC